MKAKPWLFISLVLVLTGLVSFNSNSNAQLPKEQPLWPNGIPNNPVKYKEEKLRTDNVRKSSESQLNRVFSCVSTPTYIIHKPLKGKGNGVAIVICPGGGFRDVWFDREGNDFGLWLAQRGITSLVLKYRTFNTDAEGFKLSQADYFPQVYADAKQAIYILRSNAKELDLDVNKVGICGFSAGGSLSLRVALGLHENQLPSFADFHQVSTKPDFTGLFYPGLDQSMISMARKVDVFPPSFIMNGVEDKTTELKGKSIGIIGLGTLGQMVAKTAIHFGMHVYYFSRNRKYDLEKDGITFLTMNELLKSCDIITTHLPKNTILLTEKEFKIKKANSVLVNTSLGLTFEKEPFLKWITSDKTSYAIFDSDGAGNFKSEFAGYENIVVAEESAGFTAEARKRLSEKVLHNLKDYLG